VIDEEVMSEQERRAAERYRIGCASLAWTTTLLNAVELVQVIRVARRAPHGYFGDAF
jgi:hypothetical protein